MLKIKQIEKEDLNLKNLIELSMKFNVYVLCFSTIDDIVAGKRIRDLRLSEIENRIKNDKSYAFIYVEKEEKE